MGINVMNLVLAKTIAEREGVSSDRALQLGLVGSMMPSYLGVVVAMTVARREAPDATPAAPPAYPSESMDALLARASVKIQRLTTETNNAVAVAEAKQARAVPGTPVAAKLDGFVTELKQRRDTLADLDPAGIQVPAGELLSRLRAMLYDQDEHAVRLEYLRKQVEAVVIPSSVLVNANPR